MDNLKKLTYNSWMKLQILLYVLFTTGNAIINNGILIATQNNKKFIILTEYITTYVIIVIN